MKKFAPFTIILLLLININVLSQSDESDESGNHRIKFGIGLDFWLSNFDSYPTIPPTNMIISIKPIHALRIEPGFGFYTDKSHSNMDGDESNYRRARFGLGSYWVITSKTVAPYIGLFSDYSRYNYDYDSNTRNESGYQFRAGPAFGLQYNIADHFSVNGEFLVLNKHEKNTQVYNDESNEYNSSSWNTVTKLSFRFYF